MSLTQRVVGRAGRFLRRSDGGVAMEFALVVPVLAMIFLGSAGMFDHFRARNKAVFTVDAVADLMGRTLEMTDNERKRLYAAAKLMLGKYADRVDTKMVLTGLKYDAVNDRMVVEWTRGCGMLPHYTAGNSLSASQFPMMADGEMLVQSYLEFKYHSTLYFLNSEKVTYKHEAVRKPRYGSEVKYIVEESGSSESDIDCD